VVAEPVPKLSWQALKAFIQEVWGAIFTLYGGLVSLTTVLGLGVWGLLDHWFRASRHTATSKAGVKTVTVTHQWPLPLLVAMGLLVLVLFLAGSRTQQRLANSTEKTAQGASQGATLIVNNGPVYNGPVTQVFEPGAGGPSGPSTATNQAEPPGLANPRTIKMGAMKVETAFLANHVESHDGLTFITGGLPEYWSTPAWGLLQHMGIVIVSRVERDELGAIFKYEVVLRRPDGNQGSVLNIGVTRPRRDNDADLPSYYSIIAVNFSVDFRQGGLHHFLVQRDGQTVFEVPIDARLTPLPAPGQGNAPPA
jgi:hypothetical protein